MSKEDNYPQNVSASQRLQTQLFRDKRRKASETSEPSALHYSLAEALWLPVRQNSSLRPPGSRLLPWKDFSRLGPRPA